MKPAATVITAAKAAANGGVTHHFYLRDRLGSTRAVFGMDGAPDPMAGDYPATSPYANRGCNPIRYLDPSGEVIVILCYDKRYRLVMNDGLFQGFYEDDETYNNQDDRDPFLKSVLSAITEMAKGAFGAELVKYLMDAKETVTITESSGINSYNSNGRVVKWNPKEENGGPSKDNNGNFTTKRSPFIGLANEFGHAGDHINGTFNNSVWSVVRHRDYNTIITYSEKNAMMIENFIRLEHNHNSRLYYDYIQLGNNYHPIGAGSLSKIPGNKAFVLTLLIKVSLQMTIFKK